METWNFSVPAWANPVAEQQLKAVPCFSEKEQPVPCFLEPPSSATVEPESASSGNGTVSTGARTWVDAVLELTDAEATAAYRKVEAIHARHGEEAAQRWILDNMRNFLDNAIDASSHRR